MSTLHRAVHETDTLQKKVVKRKGKKDEKNDDDIPCCPPCVNMGGVDYCNQIMKYYNCGRKSKIYRHLFYHLLELYIDNSFVLESYFVTFKKLTSKQPKIFIFLQRTC